MFGYKEELQYEISGLKDEIRELKAENEKLKLRLSDVSNRREQLIAFANYCEREWNCTEVPTDVIDEYLESN
jgi:predicted RNase H-like nuclease (RuvC/YqgF family)